jgi:nucleotide-binding universal stress UspA family protein
MWVMKRQKSRGAPMVDQFHIDVIAMSTHGRGMSRLFLGGVADKVLRGSELPMLLYRPTEM